VGDGWERGRGRGRRRRGGRGCMTVDYPCLADVSTGQAARIRAVRGERGHSRRLRELGMLEGKTVRIVAHGNPLICEVGSCRFGLCRSLACCVEVEPAVHSRTS
jgi:Fe2+ transport system protein FeoA